MSTACGQRAPQGPGPLAMGGDQGEYCIPGRTGQDFTYAAEVVENRGHQEVTIDEVTLAGGHGVTVTEAFVAPIHEWILPGIQHGWPPPEIGDQKGWDEKVTAHGSTVQPGKQHSANLITHLHLDDDDAGFEAIQVGYTADGKEYQVRSTTAVSFAENAC